MRLCMLAIFMAFPAVADDVDWRVVEVGTSTYRVAIAPDRAAALVSPAQKSAKMTTRTVERAAQRASGCRASVEPITAMATGGRVDEAINMSGKDAVRVRLRC